MKIVLSRGSLRAIVFNLGRPRASSPDVVVLARACTLHLLAFVD